MCLPWGRVTCPLFLELAGVAWFEEGLVERGRLAGLALLAALQLGIELGSKEDREVRDPQPDEQDDDAAERAVGLVVRREGRDVEGEQQRHDDEDEQRQEPAGADELEARLLDVRTIFENSLVLVMGSIWAGTWFAQSITGVTDFNAQRLSDHLPPISWLDYIRNANFWERTLQNWQSEFLAVGSMAIFAVYLRQRGSPESKPVGAPHDATGVEG